MGCSGSKAAPDDNLTSNSNNINRNKSFSRTTLVIHNKGSIEKYYKVLDKLGEGSFGKVFKALHLNTNQQRAIKVVPQHCIKYQDDEKEFLKEIEVLAKLDHPCIIKVFEYFKDKKYYYVITELATGGELYEQLSKISCYSELDAAMIMKQLFSCVYYLHEQGIVHRDLKPENLLLETQNDLSIKLIDFGAANYFENNSKEKLKLKIGTPYYIAPEVINKNYDNSCDLWSCGVIMYILLCGQPPFNGEDDDNIVENVLKGEFSFDADEWENISKDAKILIKKLLTKDTKKRITADSALKDPWIVKNCVKVRSNSEKISKIPSHIFQKFSAKQKLQQASISFLIHQISTNDMVQNLRAIFKEMDTSGDGRLSIQELKEGYSKYFSQTLSNVEFDELLKNIDLDQSGFIEYEEFLRATVNIESLLTEKNLQMAFEYFDSDNSGKLSIQEVKSILGVKSEKENDLETMEFMRKIMEEVDTNGDGEICFEEFKILMKKSFT